MEHTFVKSLRLISARNRHLQFAASRYFSSSDVKKLSATLGIKEEPDREKLVICAKPV